MKMQTLLGAAEWQEWLWYLQCLELLISKKKQPD